MNAIFSYAVSIDGEAVAKRSENTTTLSVKYQISVPKQVREENGWKPGQKFVFVQRDGGVSIIPAPSWDDVQGLKKGADPTDYRDRKDRY